MRNIVQARKRREGDPILEGMRVWVPKLGPGRSADAQIFREGLNAIEWSAVVDSIRIPLRILI
jgi:hypothetical protein